MGHCESAKCSFLGDFGEFGETMGYAIVLKIYVADLGSDASLWDFDDSAYEEKGGGGDKECHKTGLLRKSCFNTSVHE